MINVGIRFLHPVTKLEYANHVPRYATPGSGGMDILAYLPEERLRLKPGTVVKIPTGFCVQIPEGYEGQIRSRSGLSFKSGLEVVGGIGTIDSDYRGEVFVPLRNVSGFIVYIENAMRIAQLVFSPVVKANLELRTELDSTERGIGGFGSTGLK